MTDTACILCPGQGAQTVGMGRAICDAWPPARELFDLAVRMLGFDVAAACFDGPEETLNRTDVSQPALYVTGVACFRAAAAAGRLNPDNVAVCAGLSLGEYTALHLAGALSFEDGLRLVAARGRFMQEAAEACAGGMVAIIGAAEDAVLDICRRCADGQVLAPANYNAPGQVVVSGHAEACARAAAAAEAAGFRAVPLKVAGAFHSPLMRRAAERLAAELDRTPLSSPRVPVYANVTAAPHAGPAEIRRLLVEQLTHPVRWQQTMESLIARGPMRFVELAPGRTLAGLARRISRQAAVESLE